MARSLFFLFWIALFNVASNAQDKVANKRILGTNARILCENMNSLRSTGIMFGHQDDLAYGVHWKYKPGQSDVKSICSDYPAVYGWDLGNLELGYENNLDTVSFNKIREYIREIYARGGINTISWHANNPFTGGTSWDVSSKEVVKNILPGGNKHEVFKEWLNRMADFFLSLTNDKGELIPVIFRPYHEHNGSWFWWGRNLCSKEEYIQLWRFTVNYFSKEKKIDHLLYAYSPGDGFGGKENYLERYPGDDMIDLLGFDAYQHNANNKLYVNRVRKSLEILTNIAVEKGKIPILSETGFETIPNADWWTNGLWETIKDFNISYVLLWRNAYGRPDHFYIPYPGQKSEKNFKKFYNLSGTLFQGEITKANLYKQ